MGDSRLDKLADANDGILPTSVLLTEFTKRECRRMVEIGTVHRVWHGIYSTQPPVLKTKLAGLDAAFGVDVVACIDTAAALWSFDVKESPTVHILDPLTRDRNNRKGLVVHQRLGAPMTKHHGRWLTEPNWTAIEFARTLPRPRALAALDAALRSRHCSPDGLAAAAEKQAGRRGIVQVRKLLELSCGEAASPMESESRLIMLDGGLPAPQLQFPVLDERGMAKYFLDFAWPGAKVGAEYDSDAFHGGPLDVRRDKARISWLQDHGWLIIYITADDIRRPRELVARIRKHLIARSSAA